LPIDMVRRRILCTSRISQPPTIQSAIAPIILNMNGIIIEATSPKTVCTDSAGKSTAASRWSIKNLCPMANHNARKAAACPQLPARPSVSNCPPVSSPGRPAASRRQPTAAMPWLSLLPPQLVVRGAAGGIDHAAGTEKSQPQSALEQQLAAQNGHKAINSPLDYPRSAATLAGPPQIAWPHKLLRPVPGMRAALHGVIWSIKTVQDLPSKPKSPTKEVKRSALGASHLPRERISAMRASGINGRHGAKGPGNQKHLGILNGPKNVLASKWPRGRQIQNGDESQKGWSITRLLWRT
jgi:hypothetical protein